MAELAVALALLATLVLGGATLLFSLSHSAREGQNRSLLQADLQEVRSRLAQDVIQSSGFSCAANGQSANLDLSGHSVIYSLSQGKVWRNNQALTLQGEYEGTFACNDPLLGLKLSYRGGGGLCRGIPKGGCPGGIAPAATPDLGDLNSAHHRQRRADP